MYLLERWSVKLAEPRAKRWDKARLIQCFEASRTVGQNFMFPSGGGTCSPSIKVAKSGSKLVYKYGFYSSLHARFIETVQPGTSIQHSFWIPDRIERGEDSRTTVMVRNVAGNNARKEPFLGWTLSVVTLGIGTCRAFIRFIFICVQEVLWSSPMSADVLCIAVCLWTRILKHFQRSQRSGTRKRIRHARVCYV